MADFKLINESEEGREIIQPIEIVLKKPRLESGKFQSEVVFMKGCLIYAARVCLVIFLLCIGFFTASSLASGLEDNAVEIRLAREHFNPLNSLPGQARGLKHILAHEAGGVGYYIVQFDGPIDGSRKKVLEDLGVKIFDYIPDFAFIIKMDVSEEGPVRGLSHVRWLGIFQPAYKVSQRSLDMVYTKRPVSIVDKTPPVRLHISVFQGENIDSIKTMINTAGGNVLDAVTTEWGTTMKIEVYADKIPDLSYITGIKWIEPEPQWKLLNNVSTDVMNVRTPRDSYGLYGQGQTVGLADGGIDKGSAGPAGLHLDFTDGAGHSRVTSLFDLVGDGAADVKSGHGTHVAGSVLGSGVMSGCNPSTNSFPPTCFAGIAPKANLVFQAIENNTTGILSGLPTDLNTLFGQSQKAGANLHTDSWGYSSQSAYNIDSQQVDQYMWGHKDFLILFAASNDGTDLNADGVVDLYSIGTPGTSKNCLTVGASEGNRPGFTDKWGIKKGFSSNPLFSDSVSNNPGGMAAFSSRGPTLDGRYKPDLVAPGTYILSTRSSLATGTGWGAYNQYYMFDGGTSMSAPLTAGTAALLREYLMKVKGLTPSAALVKAALINSATDIFPGQYGTGATREIPSTAPNNVEGWGRVNLVNGVYPATPFNILYYDKQTGLSTGGNDTYTLNVTDSNKPLKIDLVWTDYPGSPVSQGGLVNDLDLTVIDPASALHYPDNAVHKSTVSTLSNDSGNDQLFSTNDKRAMRFTPLSYPVNVESAEVVFYNPADTIANVDVVVYAADGTGGLPGTERFRTRLVYVPDGLHTIGITGVVITSGDFYVAIEKTDAAQGIYVDSGNPSGRSYFNNGVSWAPSGYTPYIRANVRGIDYATPNDRVNNVEGITITTPNPGAYTVKVSGYNIPHGPQPYALVVSGDITTNNNPCAAILSSNLDLHIPILTLNNQAIWVDFAYIPGTVNFSLTGAGWIMDTSPFTGCLPSTLAPDLSIHTPTLLFSGHSFWADFQYAGYDAVWTLTGAEVN